MDTKVVNKRKRGGGGGGGGEESECESESETTAVEVYKSDDSNGGGGDVIQTKTDYYIRYDTQDVTVQVDIDCLLSKTGIAKRADTLRIIVFSFSPTGEAERVLVESSSRNTETVCTVTLQVRSLASSSVGDGACAQKY